MHLRTRARRRGISLLEVLTAIFIMGIGMLALLTLFPLGALSMARAIRDDRAAHIAANAAALAAAVDLRNDKNVIAAMDATNFLVDDPALPGNPVFVDPFYVRLPSWRPLGEWPYNSGTTAKGINRAAPTYVYRGTGIPLPLLNRWFTFQDEIEFDKFGGAAKWENNTVNRPGTYTHAYLLRRPVQSTRDVVEMSVVIYSSRNTDVFDGESVIYNAGAGSMGAAGTTTLTVNWNGQPKPDYRKGTWILDTTYDGATGKKTVNGFFYRIENVTETGPTQYTLEVDRQLRAGVNTIVLMKNVIAVVDRGTSIR